jgi:hypothetical protein
MAGVLRYRSAQVPRQVGELARVKVVQGPDYGSIYVLTAKSVTIGRGEENDLVLTDLKASRKHAQLSLGRMGWEVSDAGSANGILWNGKPTPGSVLRTGDVVTIGETQLEFIASEAGTQVLLAPPTSPGAVALKQASTPGLSAAGGVPGSSRVGSGAALKNPRTLLLTAGVILAAIFLFEEEKPKGRPAATGPKPLASAARDLSSYLPRPGETVPGGKTAEGFFKSGFREYRLGNYLRARAHFETTLQLEPGHLLASIYLENSKKKIDEEIKFHLDRGRKCVDSGKVKTARGHFEAVMRLLFRDPSNPAFVEARDQLEKLEGGAERGAG